MKKKIIIVTGSCGRIGSNVVRRLGKKYPIVGFELLKAIYASDQEELVPVDLSSDESVHQAFDHIRCTYGTKIASVIHLAAYYSFKEKHSDKYDEITVRGTEGFSKHSRISRWSNFFLPARCWSTRRQSPASRSLKIPRLPRVGITHYPK